MSTFDNRYFWPIFKHVQRLHWIYKDHRYKAKWFKEKDFFEHLQDEELDTIQKASKELLQLVETEQKRRFAIEKNPPPINRAPGLQLHLQ